MEQTKQDEAGRAAWLAAAHQLLLDQGVDAVSIAGLARQLGVTRGAFYWHFDSRETLLQQLLVLFVEHAMPPAFSQLRNLTCEAGFFALLDHAYLPDQEDRMAQRHLRVLQNWAERDVTARKALKTVIRTRTRTLRHAMHEWGYSYSDARIRAHALDRMLLGTSATHTSRNHMAYATDLAHLFRIHAGFEPRPDVLSHHINRTLPARRKAIATAAANDARRSAPQRP